MKRLWFVFNSVVLLCSSSYIIVQKPGAYLSVGKEDKCVENTIGVCLRRNINQKHKMNRFNLFPWWLEASKKVIKANNQPS